MARTEQELITYYLCRIEKSAQKIDEAEKLLRDTEKAEKNAEVRQQRRHAKDTISTCIARINRERYYLNKILNKMEE